MRVPGYPAFLAAIFTFAGNSPRAVMFGSSCRGPRHLFLDRADRGATGAGSFPPRAWRWPDCGSRRSARLPRITRPSSSPRRWSHFSRRSPCSFCSKRAARAADFRRRAPYSGSIASPLVSRRHRRGIRNAGAPGNAALASRGRAGAAREMVAAADWAKLLRAGVLMGAGLLLPLAAVGGAQWRTLHEVQFLAPRYTELPGRIHSLWLQRVDQHMALAIPRRLSRPLETRGREISVDDFPPSAFDSPEERARVAHLLDPVQRHADD